MTWHRQGAEIVVDKLLEAPDGAVVWKRLRQVQKALQAGAFGWVGAAFAQQQRGYDIYDAHAFACLQDDLHAGRILVADIEVGKPPVADVQVDENNRRLADIAGPFRADFAPEQGGGADCDGQLHWPVAIEVQQVTCGECSRGPPDCRKLSVEPGNAPLEIGATTATRSFAHLHQFRRLARWPYGSDRLYLFIRTDDERGRL